MFAQSFSFQSYKNINMAVEKKWTSEEIATDAVGKKEIINFLNGMVEFW